MNELKSTDKLEIGTDETKALAALKLRNAYANALAEGWTAEQIHRIVFAHDDSLQLFKTDEADKLDRALLESAGQAHTQYHSAFGSNHSNYALGDAIALAGGQEGMRNVALYDVVEACDDLIRRYRLPLETLLAFAMLSEDDSEVKKVNERTRPTGIIGGEGYGATGYG